MIIRRKIYWHAAVIANDLGAYNPEGPAATEQDAISTLQKNGDTTSAWLLNSAASYIYGVKNCKKISASLNIQNNEVLDVDSNGNTMGLRADNPLVAPGEVRFVLPPDILTQLLGAPVEVSTASDLINLEKTPIRYRLFAVYKSGPGISCADRSVPNAWFSAENIPEEVVPFNDGASRLAIKEAMGPIADLDEANKETGFYVKIKRYDAITRIGCCGIDASGTIGSSSSSSSSLPGTENCPTTPLPTYISDSNEYRIWMVRQNANVKFKGDPGVAELAYADISGAIDTQFGSINPSLIEWNHAGFINFEDVNPKIYSSFANPVFYGNQSGDRSRSRIITPEMFDAQKGMPVYLQHIAWDNRGFLWALCSGGFKMLPSDNPESALEASFTTTEGIYRLIPGGWYYATSHAYCWGGGNTGSKVGASLLEPIVGKFRQVACGYVESNSSPYTAFNIFLDEDGYIHVRAEGWNTTNVRSSWPNFNANGVRFSEIDAGNGIICAISTAGKLYAWNMLSPSDATNWNTNKVTVDAANASTDLYVHCCVSLTSPCAFILASREDGISVDKFSGSGKTSIFSIPTGSVIQRLSAGNAWSAAYYIDSSSVGRIAADGYIFSDSPANQLANIIGTKLNTSNIVDMDGGYDFLAVCYKPTDDPTSDSYVRTFAAQKASGYMIPDELRILANTVSGSRVYAGYDRLIVVDSSNNHNVYGADNYIYSSNVYNGAADSSGFAALGRSISTGLHSKDGIGGSRKYAVLVSGQPDDNNNGSVSIWIKYLPDSATGSSVGQNPNGRWNFLKKIYANSFSGSWAGSEFGLSAFVAENNDIIVGAPGTRKVCVIRKSTSSIDYSAHAVIDSPVASPESLTSDNRFGHMVKWMPIGSAYGSIIISAPTVTSNSSATANGALVISAYSDTGTPDARRKAIRISDFITSETFSASRFGFDFDACMPVISSSAGIVPGRYNIVASDTISNKILQFNLKADATDLAELVGSVDVINAPAEYTSAVPGSHICVQYTAKSSSLIEKKPQLVVSWTNALAPVSPPDTQRGDVWVLDPQVDSSSGTLNYDTDLANATKLDRVVPDTSTVLNVTGTGLYAEKGVILVSSSAYIIANSNEFVRNFYDLYLIKDSPSASGKPMWEKTAFLSYSSIVRSNYNGIFTSAPTIANFKIYPGIHISFMRQYLGYEIMTQAISVGASNHKAIGFINSHVIKEYPTGIGRRISDIDATNASIPVKCAGAGIKHQVIVCADGSHYSLPRYVDARMCTSSPISNEDEVVTDQNLRIAVPKKDPVSGNDVDENIYHFGSMSAFMYQNGTIGSNYYVYDMPIYSSITKTVRVAEMHWRPFKVLDKPLDYDTLPFEGYAKFKPKCDPINPPPNVVEGQSGAFNPPRLEADGTGTSEADIDNFDNAKTMIDTAQVFYKAGAGGNAASYINSTIGVTSSGAAINDPSNVSNPLDSNLENIESVPFIVSYSSQTAQGYNDNPIYRYLYDIKYAYYGHYRTGTPAGSPAYPNYTERIGMDELDTDVTNLSSNVNFGRKVFWNCIGEKVVHYDGPLRLYVADVLCSYLQPSVCNKGDQSFYENAEWHRYLSHPTDTAHKVSILERQSVRSDTAGIYNPLADDAIYDSTPLHQMPSHAYQGSTLAAPPWNSFIITSNPQEFRFFLAPGMIYKRYENPPGAPPIQSTLAFYDFTGRGAGLLVSHRGTRVCWSKLSWPVLRNVLDLNGFNTQNGTAYNASNAPGEQNFNSFAPGWSGSISTDTECMIAGMTVFPINSQTVNNYGLVSGYFFLANSTSAPSASKSQVGYLYSLKYIQLANGSRVPVNLAAEGGFIYTPKLHAIGCAGVYIEDTSNPAAGELLIISSATFSSGRKNGSSSTLQGRQHIWLQKRPYNGTDFSGSLLDVSTTMPQPTDNAQLITKGWDFKASQGNFISSTSGDGITGSSTLLKTVSNHTSINVWNVGSSSNPLAVVAIGGRAFSMRRNASGSSALASAITDNSIDGILSSVVELPMSTGLYYNIWTRAFDNATTVPPVKFGTTSVRAIQSEVHTMAMALGSGIPFYINNQAHVWYAGYVYKITPAIANTADSIGGVTLEDVTNTVLASVSDLIGPSSNASGDYIQGFVSGYANRDWFVIANTRDETRTISVLKIESSTGTIEFDSSLSYDNLGMTNADFSPEMNLPYKLGVVINGAGSSLSVCNHKLTGQTTNTNQLSNEYKTGYNSPDMVEIFTKINTNWIPNGDIVSSQISTTNNKSMFSFSESISLYEASNRLTVSSGSDLAFRSTGGAAEIQQSFHLSDTSAKRKRPSKLHHFNLSGQASATAVAECNDLIALNTAGFVGSAYNNLNFWSSLPVTARNGSQSMVFSSADNSMYMSTLGELVCMVAKNDGSWKLAGASKTAKPIASVSAFKYPYPNGSCFACGTTVADDMDVIKAPRIKGGLASGVVADGKRAMGYRPSEAPVLLGVDVSPAPAPSTGSTGIADLVPEYGTNGSISAPYFKKLNEKTQIAEWDATNGYKLSYNPSTRAFVKRYDLKTATSLSGVGLTLLNSEIVGPAYKASFATCPPVWDADAELWCWAGLRPIRLSSSHTYDKSTSSIGMLSQISYSDVFGISCFQFNPSYIYAIRETTRGSVSSNDDNSSDHIQQLTSIRHDDSQYGASDSSSRTGEIILIKSPADPAASGAITSDIALSDFFNSGTGTRFLMNGAGSVTIGATNPSAGAKDEIKICKSGLSPYARNRSASGVGSVLILIDDSTAMDAAINSSLISVFNDYDDIPVTSSASMQLDVTDDDLTERYRLYGRPQGKYAVDNESPLYRNTKFLRIMRSIIRMFDPLDGDLFLGDQILVACSSALTATSPTGQTMPAVSGGKASPLLCVCQNDAIMASMRMSSWTTNSTSDIFDKITRYAADGTYVRGSLFDIASPPSASSKFDHVIILCGAFTIPASVSASSFASKIFTELTQIGATGLMKSSGNIHVIDLSPEDKREYKQALGEYGTYCVWRGGGL